jgi:hypothetical protein
MMRSSFARLCVWTLRLLKYKVRLSSSLISKFKRNLLPPSSGFTVKSYKFKWSRVTYTSHHPLLLQSRRESSNICWSPTAVNVSYVLHRLLYLMSNKFENYRKYWVVKVASWISGFGGLEEACWHLEPKFAGSNPAEAVGYFRAKNFSARLPSEGSHVVDLRHVKGPWMLGGSRASSG